MSWRSRQAPRTVARKARRAPPPQLAAAASLVRRATVRRRQTARKARRRARAAAEEGKTVRQAATAVVILVSPLQRVRSASFRAHSSCDGKSWCTQLAKCRTSSHSRHARPRGCCTRTESASRFVVDLGKRGSQGVRGATFGAPLSPPPPARACLPPAPRARALRRRAELSDLSFSTQSELSLALTLLALLPSPSCCAALVRISLIANVP